VGDIIDAVGEGMAGSTCNAPGSGKYWTQEPTAVIVTWDDWGGWYDHINPDPTPGVWRGTWDNSKAQWDCPAPNSWGCGYTYGFRVPLLVASPYTGTKTTNGVTNYVSGACGASPLPSCGPNTSQIYPYVHDFGSILAFTEWNFGMSFIDGPPDDGYADYNAPDWSTDHKTTPPLSDFFALPTARQFVHVDTGNYGYTCFTKVGSCWTENGQYVPEAADEY
jgi:hypothetical protein